MNIEPPVAMLLVFCVSVAISLASPWAYLRLVAWLLIPAIVAFFAVDHRGLFTDSLSSLSTRVTMSVMLIFTIAGIPVSGQGIGLGYGARRAILGNWRRIRPSEIKTSSLKDDETTGRSDEHAPR